MTTDWPNWTPNMEATLLFIVRGGEVLLIHKKRGLGAGKINGPGGKIDPGETPVACAVREVQEELRITAVDPEEMGLLRFAFTDGLNLECTVFRASNFTGEPTETEEALPEWFAIEEVPYDKMWDDDQHWLPGMLAGGKFSARFDFDGEAMTSMEIEWRH